MSIRLEQIDELRKRAGVSYTDAKEALEICEGDMVEALVYLEKNNKVKSKYAAGEKHCFFDKVKALIKKGNDIRFIMKKNDKIIINLSFNISLLITIFAFHVTIIGLLLALIFGYRFKFETSQGEDVKANQTLDKVQDSIQDIKNNIINQN